MVCNTNKTGKFSAPSIHKAQLGSSSAPTRSPVCAPRLRPQLCLPHHCAQAVGMAKRAAKALQGGEDCMVHHSKGRRLCMPSKRLRAPRPTLLPQPLLQEALGSGSGHNPISEHAPSQPNEAPEQDRCVLLLTKHRSTQISDGSSRFLSPLLDLSSYNRRCCNSSVIGSRKKEVLGLLGGRRERWLSAHSFPSQPDCAVVRRFAHWAQWQAAGLHSPTPEPLHAHGWKPRP